MLNYLIPRRSVLEQSWDVASSSYRIVRVDIFLTLVAMLSGRQMVAFRMPISSPTNRYSKTVQMDCN